jgi:rhodanese-related sulfurtransferase
MERLTPEQAQNRLESGDALLIDVREPMERDLARLDGSIDIPLAQLPQHLDTLPRNRALILMCHHGVRSAMAADFLERHGFERVINLEGGIDAWSRDLDSGVPRY